MLIVIVKRRDIQNTHAKTEGEEEEGGMKRSLGHLLHLCYLSNRLGGDGAAGSGSGN